MNTPQMIKDYFTDQEWDAIYDALTEYRECVDDESVDSAYSKVVALFQTKWLKTQKQSSLLFFLHLFFF